MTAGDERWQQLQDLFDRARAVPLDRREACLEQACPDAVLREEVGALLRAHDALEACAGEGFLDSLDPTRVSALLASAAEGQSRADRGGLAAGDMLDRFRVVRRLGQGGMGVVYLARDERLDRPVALKLLPRHLTLDETARRRFEEEARAASALDHPHIGTIYEIDEAADGRIFLAMASYDGETLRQKLERGRLPVAEAIALAVQLADGLGAAHARGIVHRDIKPANVIVTPDGVAKIVDFGIAKVAGSVLTQTGATLGTVAYMSPEQSRGERVDRRTDLWSLGVVLYEMLAGERPFTGEHPDAVMFAIRHDDPRPLSKRRPEVPHGLELVVRRCLAKDPGERYQSAEEVRADLQALLEATPRSRRAKTIPLTAAVLVAITLAAGILVATIGTRFIGGSPDDSVASPAASVAVLPPGPVSDDSALVRLGRELSITLSATLDGMGGIRTVSAGTLLGQLGHTAPSLEEGATLAARLGASGVLHGTLLRASQGRVRLELGLFTVDGLEPVARATVTASDGDLNALTDSAAMVLLRQVWSRGKAPVPSLAAVTTGSLPALRAYLEGELALSHGEYDRAVPAFERAFAIDSTFWLAYWRSLYPRVYEGSRPDSAVLARMLAYRDQLPDPYRLLLDAYTAETLGSRLELLRSVTARFPTFWPGWYDYADALLHLGPYLGSTYADAQAGLERVVALNPEFASAWQHLLWTAVRMRDTLAADRALAALERLASPTAIVSNSDNLIYYRALHGVLQAQGELTDDAARELAAVALRAGPRLPPETVATDLLAHGFPRAQLKLADAVLSAQPSSELAAAQWMAKAFAWAARGAWDSTLVAADAWVRLSDDPQTPLRAYGLAVTGAWLGAIDDGTALRWRPEPPSLPATSAAEAEAEAERLWLDGILAYSRGDQEAIARGRRQLRAAAAASADLLAASLHAFERHAAGDGAGAARSLAALEWAFAEHELPAPRRAGTGNTTVARFHPYVSAIHRLAAAHWILEAGDTLQSMRLLSWHEAVLAGDRIYVRMNTVNRMVEPLALYERARLEEARGREQHAREHYQAFLERYDRPPKAHESRVGQARAALRRLSPSTADPGAR